MGQTNAQIQERFLTLYRSDPVFHERVDRLLAGEVDDLRVALTRISGLRCEDFATRWHYETAVRKEADNALRQLAWTTALTTRFFRRRPASDPTPLERRPTRILDVR